MVHAFKVVALAAALSTTGCSFLLVRGPGETGTPPRVYAECHEWSYWPLVDGGLALLYGAAAVSVATRDPKPDQSDADRQGVMITSTILAAVAGASAIIGYRRTSACKEQHESYLAAYPQGQPAYYPQPYPPQQPPPYVPPQPQAYPPPQPQPVQPPPPAP